MIWPRTAFEESLHVSGVQDERRMYIIHSCQDLESALAANNLDVDEMHLLDDPLLSSVADVILRGDGHVLRAADMPQGFYLLGSAILENMRCIRDYLMKHGLDATLRLYMMPESCSVICGPRALVRDAYLLANNRYPCVFTSQISSWIASCSCVVVPAGQS